MLSNYQMKKITLSPSGVELFSDGATNILEVALQNNIALSYSCKSGSCGACKATVIDGDVESLDPFKVLSADEVQSGSILTCCSKAKSDCVIEAEFFPELADIEQKTVPAKIESINFPSSDIAIIKLRLPPSTDFKYLSGQYLDMSFGGASRSYSIANRCVHGNGIELHIRKVAGGVMSEKVFLEMSKNTLVRLNGPIGTFFVRKSERPIVFLAGGTGFAPVKAMVEGLIANNSFRHIHIYWGAVEQSGIYSDVPEGWAGAYRNVSYTPVISEEDSEWEGRTGFVHSAVMSDFSSLDSFDVYACGSPLMIGAARNDFIGKGLPAERFFSDAFVPYSN